MQLNTWLPFSDGRWEGEVLDTIAVVFIVCIAAGYLVWRYVKKAKTGGGCECENIECPLKGSGSGSVEDSGGGMVCESKTCNDDPFQEQHKGT